MSNGSRSTVFVPPISTLDDISDFQSESSGGLTRKTSLVSSHHDRTVDDSVIVNQEYVYRDDPRAIVPSRGNSLRRSSSLTDLDEEFAKALKRRNRIGGAASPVTASSGSSLGKDVYLNPAPSANRARSEVSDENFFSSGSAARSSYLSAGSGGTTYDLNTRTSMDGFTEYTRQTATSYISETQPSTSYLGGTSATSYEGRTGSSQSYSTDPYTNTASPLSRTRGIRRRNGRGTATSQTEDYSEVGSYAGTYTDAASPLPSGTYTQSGTGSGSRSYDTYTSTGSYTSGYDSRTGTYSSGYDSRADTRTGTYSSGYDSRMASRTPDSEGLTRYTATTDQTRTYTPTTDQTRTYTPTDSQTRTYTPTDSQTRTYTPTGSYTYSGTSGITGTVTASGAATYETGYNICQSSDFTSSGESRDVYIISGVSSASSDSDGFATASQGTNYRTASRGTSFHTASPAVSPVSTTFESLPSIPSESESNYVTASRYTTPGRTEYLTAEPQDDDTISISASEAPTIPSTIGLDLLPLSTPSAYGAEGYPLPPSSAGLSSLMPLPPLPDDSYSVETPSTLSISEPIPESPEISTPSALTPTQVHESISIDITTPSSFAIDPLPTESPEQTAISTLDISDDESPSILTPTSAQSVQLPDELSVSAPSDGSTPSALSPPTLDVSGTPTSMISTELTPDGGSVSMQTSTASSERSPSPSTASESSSGLMVPRGVESDVSYDSSILAPSPSFRSLTINEGYDNTFDSSVLRPSRSPMSSGMGLTDEISTVGLTLPDYSTIMVRSEDLEQTISSISSPSTVSTPLGTVVSSPSTVSTPIASVVPSVATTPVPLPPRSVASEVISERTESISDESSLSVTRWTASEAPPAPETIPDENSEMDISMVTDTSLLSTPTPSVMHLLNPVSYASQ